MNKNVIRNEYGFFELAKKTSAQELDQYHNYDK
jgi:hypothetical protein